MAQLNIIQPHLNHADHSQFKDAIYMAKGGSGYTQGLPDQAGGLFFTVYQDPNTNHTSGSETRAIGSQYYLNTDGIIWSRTGYNLGYQGGLGGGRYRTTWYEWKQITLKGINDINIENTLRHLQDEIGELQQERNLDDVYKHINNSELTGNIDNYNKLGSQKYRNVTSTPEIPNGHGNGYGTIFYIPEHKDPSGHKGMQLLNSTTHQCLYYRTSNEGGSWQQWHRIATGTDAILKPEAQPKYTTADLNDIKKTCIYKVSGDNGNRPVASSEGIVQTLAGDNNRYSQIWYGVSGKGNNRVFFRSFNDGRWYNWKEIATTDSIQQQTIQETFRHNPQRIDDVKTIMHSGYYHTTQSTLHLPTQIDDNESKNGVLLVIKKDTKLHYEYTPIAGKYKNQMYIGDFDTTLRAGSNINWYKVSGAEGHIKVHDTRSTKQIDPQEYYQHTDSSGSGYIVYEWKWSSDIGLQDLIQGHQNDDILLMTIIPVSKEQVQYDTLINQKAYDLKTHRTFVRNSTKQANNWSEWTEIGAGGQAIPPIKVNTNIQTPLVNMFKAWADYYKNLR